MMPNTLIKRVLMRLYKLLSLIVKKMSGNTKFFNRIFYIQKYYDIFRERHIWRFWILGYYFEMD
jgi:hypothetical protein